MGYLLLLYEVIRWRILWFVLFWSNHGIEFVSPQLPIPCTGTTQVFLFHLVDEKRHFQQLNTLSKNSLSENYETLHVERLAKNEKLHEMSLVPGSGTYNKFLKMGKQYKPLCIILNNSELCEPVLRKDKIIHCVV